MRLAACLLLELSDFQNVAQKLEAAFLEPEKLSTGKAIKQEMANTFSV